MYLTFLFSCLAILDWIWNKIRITDTQILFHLNTGHLIFQNLNGNYIMIRQTPFKYLGTDIHILGNNSKTGQKMNKKPYHELLCGKMSGIQIMAWKQNIQELDTF